MGVNEDREQSRMKNRYRPSSGAAYSRVFTVIEMIWVLVVIMIIAGMSVGIASSMSRGGGVDGGARMLSRQLFLSRDYAIMNRSRIALLLPKRSELPSSLQGVYGGTNDHETIAMRACKVTSSGAFVEYVGDKWEIIPQRVVLDLQSTTNLSTVTNVGIVEDSGTTTPVANVSAIVFKPNGSLEMASDVTNLLVTSGSGKEYTIQVNWMTGKARFIDN